MSSTETELKLEIKAWEHVFKKQNGKNPTKDDIKKNAEIAAKYKEYRNLKYMIPKTKTSSKSSSIYSTPTKTRTKVIPQFHTPHKTSSPMKQESPLDVDELGPTPQLNGRVLGLFEVITSPKVTPEKSTPQKIIPVIQETTTLTSVKKNIDFSQLDDSDDDRETEQTNIFKTPQKPTTFNKVQDTPLYLRPGGSKEITASPSPIASQRIRKGLSTIINEFRDIEAELKYGDFDDDDPDIRPLEEIKEENEEQGDGALPTWKKKKTQKRTTRRYKIKARPVTDKNTMEGKDVKQELLKLHDHKDDELESEESEDWSDGPDEFIPKARPMETATDIAKKRKKIDSQNFKRLKLRDGKSKQRNFGKRSRGW